MSESRKLAYLDALIVARFGACIRLKLVADLFMQMRHRLGFGCVPDLAFIAGCGHVLIHAIISLDKLGEACALQVAVGFGCINSDKGDKPFYFLAALRTLYKLFTGDRLGEFKDLAPTAPIVTMFIFVNRHGSVLM